VKTLLFQVTGGAWHFGTSQTCGRLLARRTVYGWPACCHVSQPFPASARTGGPLLRRVRRDLDPIPAARPGTACGRKQKLD